MAIFETHAHYLDEQFDGDREEILNNLLNGDIEYIIESATDIETSKRAIELSKKFEHMYITAGIHPECVSNVSESDYEELELLLAHAKENKIVAVGEIGLDYYYSTDNKELQKQVFIRQLELAIKYNLPVVVHAREASSDTFEIIKEYANKGLRGDLHCFSESLELAKEYVKLGFYIGVGGVVTFKNGKKLVNVTENIQLDNILLETDSPYLSPEPNRGTRNNSSNIKYVIEKISSLKDLSYEDVEKITSENAKNLFKL